MNNNEFLSNNLKPSEAEIRRMSPLVLAYIGDSVWDLVVRTYLVNQQKERVNQLHRKAVKMVCATAQATLAKGLEAVLTDEEKGYLRRGRNAKSATVPKNADAVEYRLATGFESMIGALYLAQNWDRLNIIIEHCLAMIKSEG